MHAMILAAGFGTRLASVGLDLPKPLFPVCNVPLIRWAVSFLVGHGFRDIVVNLHHRGSLIVDALGDGRLLGARIAYSMEEEEILGTGGGIRRALPLFGSSDLPLVVMNGKIVSDVDLWGAIAHHRATGALATMVLSPTCDAARWGAIGVDPQGRIRRFLGTPDPGCAHAVDLTETMFTGIHVMEPELLAALPDGPSCIVRAGYRPSFERGAPLAGYIHRGYFWDHSTPERWLKGNLNLVAAPEPARDNTSLDPGPAPGALPPCPSGVIRFAPTPLRGVHPTARVAAGARVHEAVLVGRGATVESGAELGPGVVVGDGALITSGAHLSRALVHGGGTARGTIKNAIVTGNGQVHPMNPDDTGPATGPALGATGSGS